jgi:hypothetical protein
LGSGSAIQPGIVSLSKSIPISSTRHGEVIVLTVTPSTPIAMVETPVALSLVQFIDATWKLALHGVGAV